MTKRRIILTATLLALSLAGAQARTVLFLGSSMTYGAHAAAQRDHAVGHRLGEVQHMAACPPSSSSSRWKRASRTMR